MPSINVQLPSGLPTVSQLRNMTLKEDLEFFCNSTSLRGFGKASKSPTRSLRALWTVYILAMVAALFTCVCFIVSDYSQYKTIIQSTLIINDMSSHSYPALTFCNHYPFQESAHKLWASGAVLSPTNYSKMLRRQAYEAFNKSDYLAMENVLVYDTKRVYYQTLPHEHALNVSFSIPHVFLFCIRGHGHLMDITEAGSCNFIIKSISLPSFFTCFQVQINQPHDWITLILHVVKGQQSGFEEAFVQDTFEQAHGIRLQVHENDTYPDPMAKGIHIEPGKLVEINYRHIRWYEADTPHDVCLHPQVTRSRRISDLGQDFSYSADGCIKAAIGRRVLRQCGCYYAEFLREAPPNATHPYCGDMRLGLTAIQRNLICLSHINFTELKIELSASECAMPCTYSKFETFISQTEWKATDWQLYWLLKQSQSFARLRTSQRLPHGAERERQLTEAKDDLKSLLSLSRLSNFSAIDAKLSFNSHSDEFAYVTVRRQSCNTMRKAEAQSLNFSALMSQIGGLCSLFLGLTCAVFVELVEVALMHRVRRQQKAAAATADIEMRSEQNHSDPTK